MADEKHILRFYGRRKGKIIRKGRASAVESVMPEVEIVFIPSPAPSAGEGGARRPLLGDGRVRDCPEPSVARRGQKNNDEAGTIPHPPAASKGGGPLPLPQSGGRGEDIDPFAFFTFPARAVWLEIGFGNGEHLAYMAMAHPDIGFIGCEPFENGVAALCRDIKNNDIKNIRIWPEDARLLMARLKGGSIGRCFLLNSDPWPKTRHHKRQFIQKETLDDLHRLLKPGAELRMSSDHPSLTAWQVEKAYFHGGFSWNAECAEDWRARPIDMPETRYQKKGAGQGRATVFLSFSASGKISSTDPTSS